MSNSDAHGCIATVIGIPTVAFVLWLALDGSKREGRESAHAEFRECLSYRKAAPSDTVVITMQPKCEKWLRPETTP